MVAIRVHSAQTDRQGEPYLLHVLRVVEAVRDEAKVVAALHDIIEDGTSETRAGWVSATDGHDLTAIELLTRGDPETYASYIAYIARIAAAPGRSGDLAREVKIADLRDHLGRMPDPKMTPFFKRDWRPLQRRYERALVSLEGSQR